MMLRSVCSSISNKNWLMDENGLVGDRVVMAFIVTIDVKNISLQIKNIKKNMFFIFL